MTKKYCWVWNIKPECVEDYVKLHLNPWPEVLRAHSEAGLYDYSIFQNGNQFIYTFNCDGDPEEAFAKAVADPDVVRWNKITGPMLDEDTSAGVDAAAKYLPEIFRLD